MSLFLKGLKIGLLFSEIVNSGSADGSVITRATQKLRKIKRTGHDCGQTNNKMSTINNIYQNNKSYTINNNWIVSLALQILLAHTRDFAMK